MSSYNRWKCTRCNKEFNGGAHLVIFDLQKHVREEHPALLAEFCRQRSAFTKELSKREEELLLEYPLAKEGELFVFKLLPTKPSKKWTCPKCGKSMGYQNKAYHKSNPQYCKKEKEANE